MSIQSIIEEKLKDEFQPYHLEVINESHMHGGPATESHFKVIIVADAFTGQTPVRRHQLIYGQLSEQLNGPVHALALHAYTPDQWSEQQQTAPVSPQCRGGSKS